MSISVISNLIKKIYKNKTLLVIIKLLNISYQCELQITNQKFNCAKKKTITIINKKLLSTVDFCFFLRRHLLPLTLKPNVSLNADPQRLNNSILPPSHRSSGLYVSKTLSDTKDSSSQSLR